MPSSRISDRNGIFSCALAAYMASAVPTRPWALGGAGVDMGFDLGEPSSETILSTPHSNACCGSTPFCLRLACLKVAVGAERGYRVRNPQNNPRLSMNPLVLGQ